MSPSNKVERMKLSRTPYALVMESLMFVMVCTRPNIPQVVRVVIRFKQSWGENIGIYLRGSLDTLKGLQMLYYVLEDQNSLLKVILIKTLQVNLIKENLLQAMCSPLHEEL